MRMEERCTGAIDSVTSEPNQCAGSACCSHGSLAPTALRLTSSVFLLLVL
jgi:hypothetical protein